MTTTTEAGTMTALTPAHERFCEEYLKDLSAARAYGAAYPKAAAGSRKSAGLRLLALPPVAARVRELKRARSTRLQLTADDVVLRLQEIVELSMNPAAGRKLELMTALRALELLGKHLGLWSDQVEVVHRYIAEVPAKLSPAEWSKQHQAN